MYSTDTFEFMVAIYTHAHLPNIGGIQPYIAPTPIHILIFQKLYLDSDIKRSISNLGLFFIYLYLKTTKTASFLNQIETNKVKKKERY